MSGNSWCEVPTSYSDTILPDVDRVLVIVERHLKWWQLAQSGIKLLPSLIFLVSSSKMLSRKKECNMAMCCWIPFTRNDSSSTKCYPEKKECNMAMCCWIPPFLPPKCFSWSRWGLAPRKDFPPPPQSVRWYVSIGYMTMLFLFDDQSHHPCHYICYNRHHICQFCWQIC